ncbi:MAG: hypothetical protein MI746_13180 [Pseudomonadales bacterium]|nr:hypothetical protein [Pseudomonadales bacterium]
MELSVFDDLLSIAEITSVFVGFAVLISVLSPTVIDKARLLGMITGAAMTIVACILPVILRYYLDSTSSVIQVASIAFVILNIVGTVALFKIAPEMAAAHKESALLSMWVWSIEAVMYVLMISAAVGLWPAYAAANYFFGTCLILLQAILLFVAMILSMSQTAKSIQS